MKSKFIQRLFLVYFFIQVLPLNPEWWRRSFAEGWWKLSYGGIFNLAHYEPGFSSPVAIWPDWIAFVLLSAIVAAWWTFVKKDWLQEKPVYYWLRVAVRYRLAIAMLAYGFIKLFPLQSPYPSLSNLNTNYGDYTRWKLFSLSLGVVPSYETFLGLVEIVAALLLFNRRSASIGAFILSIFLGNVFMSNWAYGGGDAVYSLYLIGLSLFIVSYDAERLINILFLERPAEPDNFRPLLPAIWQRRSRVVFKIAVLFIFVALYGFETRHVFLTSSYQYPVTNGLSSAKGIYTVAVFKKAQREIAYSRADSLRWQDLVFENWATVSIRSNRPVLLDSVNTERPGLPDLERDYELQGSAGRHYYRYDVDTAKRLLNLYNKNPHYSTDKLVLHYERPDPNHIILSGIDQDRDSVYAELVRQDRKYLLEEASKSGRTKGLKL